MLTKLPSNLITRVKLLLLPYVQDRSDRKALLTEAFYLRDPRLRGQIDLDGNPDSFSVNCISELLEFGCLALDNERLHSLAALLLTVRARCGVDKYAEIDGFVPLLNDHCAMPTVEPPPVAPVTTPPQTIATPPDERTASVFISYSHTDEAFATRLIGELGAAGHTCWIDKSEIKGGADWQRAICDGINLSYALVVVCTRKALESEYVWDEIQWARTRRKLIIPVLLEDVTDDDRFFGLHRYQGIRFDTLAEPQALRALVAALPTPPSNDAPPRPLTQREHELAYLDRLRFEDFLLEKFELTEYAPLGGIAQTRREVRDSWATLAMEQEFAVIRSAQRDDMEIDSAPEAFTDAVSKITELRRVVVLGEPGAGKTHTLRAIAKPLYSAALTDSSAPIPLLIKLGNWDQPDQPFEAFLREALGELGIHLEALLKGTSGQPARAVLLLDGLNEFPSDQRATKYPQVERFIKAHPDVVAVVTCRQADYPISLHLHQIVIRPLDPLRIRDFAQRALHTIESDDAFFWKLVGDAARRFEVRFRQLYAERLPNWKTIFWLDATLPEGIKWDWEFVNISYYEWDRWKALRDNPSGMLTLARNPYLLRMLIDIYIQFKGQLPTNRGQLFEQFVNTLLAREKLAKIDPTTHIVTVTEEGQALLTGLQRVAYEMQVRRAGRTTRGDLSAGTTLDIGAMRGILNERLLYLAVSTSILTSGDEVRFSHQLLQEYFAARYMDNEIRAGRLQAADIWQPGKWWERTNWEEAAILLAGLYSNDCTEVLNWLEDANPELAAQCIVRSGATTPETNKTRLSEQWLPRLTDLKRDPQALARAAIGRALGLFKINDQIADTRPGVGLRPDGLPDIVWCEVNDQLEWTYHDKRHKPLPPYHIAKFPITYVQFQAFIDTPDGWHNAEWWEGLAANEDDKQLRDQYFKYWNHPRETVNWYQAVAFCRWLSAKMGVEVRLPTEFEWDRAARGTKDLVYPYGNIFDAAKGNTAETHIRQTSAVGLFVDGMSPVGALDMSGNAWEWCLNEYSNPQSEDISNANSRLLRGGSWRDFQNLARAAYLNSNNPEVRNFDIGFRVVRVGAVSSHHLNR